MATLIDISSDGRGPRHPEKQHRPDTELLRKPSWIRVKAPVSKGYQETRKIVKDARLTTVCEEAGCPNIGECWTKKHATMMIMGDTCTRACAFCNVRTGLPEPLDIGEPERVADAVAKGDFTQKITVEAAGEILEVKETVNTMVDSLNRLAAEVSRVAQVAGTEGKLTERATVQGVGAVAAD